VNQNAAEGQQPNNYSLLKNAQDKMSQVRESVVDATEKFKKSFENDQNEKADDSKIFSKVLVPGRKKE
jgi:hypothetical protein